LNFGFRKLRPEQGQPVDAVGEEPFDGGPLSVGIVEA
jgi:hypothetical protein